MKNLILILFAFLFFGTSYSQDIKKIYLTKDELRSFSNSMSNFSRPTESQYLNASKKPTSIYGYDIVYDGKIIFSESVLKPGYGANLGRMFAVFCIDFDVFDMDTKLELAESKYFKITKFDSGKKFVVSNQLELFNKKNPYDPKSYVITKIIEKIEYKFFRIDFD